MAPPPLAIAGRALYDLELAALWDAADTGRVESPELLLGLLVEIGERWEDCSVEQRALQREALVALQRHGGEWTLTGGAVLRTSCEVPSCRRHNFTIERRTPGMLYEVEWEYVLVTPAVAPAALSGLRDLAGRPPGGRARYNQRRRLGRPPGSHLLIPDGVIRYGIACPRCRERKVVRCEHDSRTPLALPSAMPEDIRRRLVKEHRPQDDWSPCGELAAGSVYCAEHQRAKYRRARAHGYLHRRRPLA